MNDTLYVDQSSSPASVTVRLKDATRTYPLHLFRDSGYMQGMCSFSVHSNQSIDSEMDLTDWTFETFMIVIDHMTMTTASTADLYGIRHCEFIRHRLAQDNVREVERLADFILYDPLRVIRVELTIMYYMRETRILFHNHQWLSPEVEHLESQYTEKCIWNMQIHYKELASELGMSVGQVHLYSGDSIAMQTRLVLINDGKMSIPSILFWSSRRVHFGMGECNANALLTHTNYSGFTSEVRCSSMQSNDLNASTK